jgi:hypothetical protein
MHIPAPRPVFNALLLACALFGSQAVVPHPASGQGPDEYRIGITLGGTGLVGLSFEMLWGQAALDISTATWAFRDVSLSAVGKYYLGNGDLRGYGGLGIWMVTSFPTSDEERTGLAWVLRAPVGGEGRIDQDHAVGVEVNFDRALAIRRPDPTDDSPPNARIVPLPGVYYRFAWERD